MEKKIKEEEVDLMDLLLKGINVIRDNFWLIFFFFLTGVGLGLLHYYTSRKTFENKMVISSSILTKSYGKILISNLTKHLSENDLPPVANDLKISEKSVKKISQIRIDNISENDEQKESDRFIVIVEVFNEDVLPELQQGLIYYLENNEFVKVRVEQNKSYLRQVISKIDREIQDMEEFKQRLFKGDFLQSIKGNIMFDPTTVNSKILELTKEKINLQNSFILANSVHVIEGFTKFEKPSKPKLSLSLLSGATIGLFFVALIIAFKSIRKLLQLADAAKQSVS